jgi:hypothetical protein
MVADADDVLLNLRSDPTVIMVCEPSPTLPPPVLVSCATEP